MAATMTALECQELEPLLHAYVDGEFEANERADFEAHLAGCEACRARVDGERKLRERLREAAAVRAPDALRRRIESGLARERRISHLRALVRPESIAVAAVAMAAGIIAFLSGRQLLEPIVEGVVMKHAHNPPVEVRGNEQQVQRWFAGKVDFPVQVPHLRNLNVSGARLSHVRDRDAAYVVYEGPQARRVSLFVFDDPRAPIELGLGAHMQRVDDRDVLLANEHGYNVVMWRNNQIVYSLVSDLDEHDILGLLSNHAQPPPAELPAPLPTPEVQPASVRMVP